ncbi:HAAS domain-containing protein [Rummeliibacillus suwonensis]|uniref:HAAS domain-containing protein n=1 Tax=Rummeliibacillus suwonensis TaxID=1306154 RepID=UPI001FD41F6F|nr:DUF1700 domain-containing protein [Rummeliibacillus suwonensis]
MSEKEKKDIVNEYIIHFTEGKRENKSEEEISKELGNPVDMAKKLNAAYAIKKVDENKSIRSMFIALLSIMGLGVMNCIISIMGFFVLLILLPFILAYIIGVPIMIVSPVILIVMGFINGFSTIEFEEVFESVKGFIIGSFLAFLGYYIGKSFVRLFIKYLRWNVSIARGNYYEENSF